VLNWLLQDFLPKIENAVILLSGRTERGSLSNDLKQVSGKQFMPIPLQGLNEEEALEYFDAVIQACKAPGESQDLEAAKSIKKLSSDQRRTIFYSLCDAEQDMLTIRPIWLALAIDYWVVAEQLLPDWEASVNDARARANQDHTNTREALRRGLLRTLREGDRAPADEVILALGLATKGADVDLLFHILGIDKTGIQKALETIRHLSFVKTRPKDNRLFLHDEMYAILQEHLRQLPRYEQWLRQITDWYNTRIDNHRKEITRLYETSEKTFYGSEKVNRVRTALYDTLVEDLHYQLRLNPRRGFETYFRYSDDAIATGNESLDAQLRSELLAFWSTNDPKWEKQDIEGLKRADVEADAAIRWVKRSIQRGDKPKARQLIAKLRGDASDLIRASGRLAEIALDVSEAHTDAYEARLEQAEEKLKEKIRELGKDADNYHIAWRNATLARAYNHLGYIYRSTGRHLGAIQHYKQARSIWRTVEIEGEQANTLTNLAFALAMVGEFGDAWRQGLDARDLRLFFGSPASVGLSLTALARIAIEEDTLDDALRYLTRAIQILETTEAIRQKGLALIARAETKRRMSAWMNNYPNETAEQLSQSVKDAEEAIAIFEKIVEPARKVEALIEKGCAYRDWVKFRRDNPQVLAEEEKGTNAHFWSLKELGEKSRQAFEQAQKIAEQYNLHYLGVDALVNLAWLYYYQSQEDQVRQTLDQAESIIPENHRITSYQRGLGGLPILDEKETVIPFFTQLGKMHLLRGQIAFNHFTQERKEQALQEAISHYTLALAYDTLFRTQEFRDLRRAKDRIYERLKVLNATEMLIAYDTVERVEREYRLGTSAMREFLQRNFGPRDDFVSGTL
jgi:tetratricopeptide (TPR) repeat protein